MMKKISIHALLAESDMAKSFTFDKTTVFLSTLSLRRATAIGRRGRAGRDNFYPRSPCGERLIITVIEKLSKDFYPRSPCGERRDRLRSRPGFSDFYPRSPCGERLSSFSAFASAPVFLSTLSLRRATSTSLPQQGQRTKFLSTLSLRRATEQCPFDFWTDKISIHALLAESDGSPVRAESSRSISIHALLAESDQRSNCLVSSLPDFYPRSPCGERRRIKANIAAYNHFYPRSPCGERLTVPDLGKGNIRFLSTLSLRRATGKEVK